MKTLGIIVNVVTVSLLFSPLAAQTSEPAPSGGGTGGGGGGSSQSMWSNLNGSFSMPGIWANWNSSRDTSVGRTRSTAYVDASLVDCYFDQGRSWFNSYSDDPAKFFGSFHWEGGFYGNATSDWGSSFNMTRRGVSVSNNMSIYYDAQNILHLQGFVSLFPAVITSDSFGYSEYDRWIGWDDINQKPITQPGWHADFSFYGYWEPMPSMTAAQVGAMFAPIPEPATMGLLAMGVFGLAAKRRR